MANANTVEPEESELWGLDGQFAQFELALGRKKPALILVTGRPSSGKSSFLREAGLRAGEQGWRIAQSDSRGDLEVGPETTEGGFSRRVLELLGDSETPGALAMGLSRLAGPGGSADGSRGVLLIVDNYRPSREFASWFTGILLKDLAGSGTPVVVAVADERSDPKSLAALADPVISLELLDGQELRRRLEAVGRELNPPMEPSELDKYVEEALKKHQIIGPLRRVLALARQGS